MKNLSFSNDFVEEKSEITPEIAKKQEAKLKKLSSSIKKTHSDLMNQLKEHYALNANKETNDIMASVNSIIDKIDQI